MTRFKSNVLTYFQCVLTYHWLYLLNCCQNVSRQKGILTFCKGQISDGWTCVADKKFLNPKRFNRCRKHLAKCSNNTNTYKVINKNTNTYKPSPKTPTSSSASTTSTTTSAFRQDFLHAKKILGPKKCKLITYIRSSKDYLQT